MSSSHFLRDFIQGRLTAAAVEIFEVFEQTIGQYEREIDRQRRLLDNNWKPEAKLQQPEELQQTICKEEVVFSDKASCQHQITSSLEQSLEQPQPETSVVEKKVEELWSSEDIAELQIKEETETVRDEETNNVHLEVERAQIISHNSAATLSHMHSFGAHVDLRLPDNAALTSNMGHCSNNGDSLPFLERQCDDDTGKMGVTCEFCGKIFRFRYLLKKHQRIHTGEKPFVCNICGKTFSQMYTLTIHMRSHTGERPFSCEICGKTFSQRQTAKVHMRIHTGEKPYLCKVCGKRFTESKTFKRHSTTHTDEKRHPCHLCWKSFKRQETLFNHIKSHQSKKLQPLNAFKGNMQSSTPQIL